MMTVNKRLGATYLARPRADHESSNDSDTWEGEAGDFRDDGLWISIKPSRIEKQNSP